MTPFDLIARKQRVGADDTALIELPVLIVLDAAKRGVCPAAGVNFLTSHMVIAVYLAKALKLPMLHKQAMAAFDAINHASGRMREVMDLTTTEYRALRDVLKSYFRVLPLVEVGILTDASRESARLMGVEL